VPDSRQVGNRGWEAGTKFEPRCSRERISWPLARSEREPHKVPITTTHPILQWPTLRLAQSPHRDRGNGPDQRDKDRSRQGGDIFDCRDIQKRVSCGSS
jgi:hypothetical protein